MDTKEIVLPKHRFLVNTEACADFTPQMFDPYYWNNKGLIFGTSHGRGTTYFINYTTKDRWVLRHYLRGGFIAKLLKDGYFYPGRAHSRPYKEFNLLAQMQQWQMPVPTPVAAHINLNFYPIAHYDILIKYIENSKDLVSILQQRTLQEEDLYNIAQSLKTLKEHKIYHHDLNIHNLMLDDQKKCWIIDFDKAQIADGHFDEMISRLRRSFVKEQAIFGDKFNWKDDQFEQLLKMLN